MSDSEDKVKRLSDREVLLGKLYLQDQINEDSYLKQILLLAADCMAEDQVIFANLLVEKVTSSYINDVLPKQIADDPAFGDQLFKLSKRFIDSGAVNLSKSWSCSVVPAKA